MFVKHVIAFVVSGVSASRTILTVWLYLEGIVTRSHISIKWNMQFMNILNKNGANSKSLWNYFHSGRPWTTLIWHIHSIDSVVYWGRWENINDTEFSLNKLTYAIFIFLMKGKIQKDKPSILLVLTSYPLVITYNKSDNIRGKWSCSVSDKKEHVVYHCIRDI